jgi:hypothetical protein
MVTLSSFSHAQKVLTDTSTKDKDLTFTGTLMTPYQMENDTSGNLFVSGYFDTYYAFYSDTAGSGGYQKFPTAAPRSGQVGINIIQVSAKYQARDFRGTTTLFYGDCPQSAWSTHLNFVQEANLGFRIYKGLWLDAGFFRTHFGLESIQPRENMTIGFATTTYFEPYFLSGVKLTWEINPKIFVQINGFNSFNTFLETNKNKAVGISASWIPNEKLSISYSGITCDESPVGFPRPQQRIYNNLYAVYKTHRMTLGLELNYGSQQNSKIKDSTKTAQMFSSLLALKYRFTSKWGAYVRGEVFEDSDEILTGPIENENHQLIGLNLWGATCGLEYKPIPNSYLRLESRYLEAKSDETIFYYNDASINYRWEIICGLGIWF